MSNRYAEARIPESFESDLDRQVEGYRKMKLSEIWKRISQQGLPKADYEDIKGFFLAPGISVAELVETEVALDTLVWVGEGSEKILKTTVSLFREAVGKMKSGGVSPEELETIKDLSVLPLMQHGMRFTDFEGWLGACLTLGLLEKAEVDGQTRIVVKK